MSNDAGHADVARAAASDARVAGPGGGRTDTQQVRSVGALRLSVALALTSALSSVGWLLGVAQGDADKAESRLLRSIRDKLTESELQCMREMLQARLGLSERVELCKELGHELGLPVECMLSVSYHSSKPGDFDAACATTSGRLQLHDLGVG